MDEKNLEKDKMYIVISPSDDNSFNMTCVDTLKEPVNDLYYLFRGILEIARTQQEFLIEVGKDVTLESSIEMIKKRFGDNVVPFISRNKK